jgi:hypothetical protein
MENLSGDPMEKKYHGGRIKALSEFRDYLIQNFNPRLPRRIREDFERRTKLS